MDTRSVRAYVNSASADIWTFWHKRWMREVILADYLDVLIGDEQSIHTMGIFYLQGTVFMESGEAI